MNDVLFSPKQEVSLPFKSTRNNNNETETVTFASVGRVYLNRNPGLFVRAAVHAVGIFIIFNFYMHLLKLCLLANVTMICARHCKNIY